MAGNKHLGVYFGSNSLSIVETDNHAPAKYFSAPHNLFDATEQQLPGRSVPDDIKLTAIIQKSLRDNKISTNEANLSLPTKDVIFRSFVVPWMSTSEVASVVEFEARKYIPFKLEELSYTHHTVPIMEKTFRKLRILFAAIRTDTLERYCNILEQSGLRVGLIEPALMSLIRVLVFKKILPLDKKVAIVQATEKEGKIIITDQTVPHFVRDFQLILPSSQKTMPDSEQARIKLFNEVRVSLDYYERQQAKEAMESLIFLSNKRNPELADGLGAEFGLSVTSVDANSLLDARTPVDSDLLYAYGIGLKDAVASLPKFDLSPNTLKSKSLQAKLARINLMTLAKTGGLCAILIGLVFFLSNFQVIAGKVKIKTLTDEVGVFYESLTAEQIDQKTADITKKLDGYKSINYTSETAFLLARIPTLLIDGTWLKELAMEYSDLSLADVNARKGITEPVEPGAMVRKLKINISGYAYLKNTNQQIRLVNSLVSNIKSDKQFTKFFEDVKLLTAQTTEYKERTVTLFRILCE